MRTLLVLSLCLTLSWGAMAQQPAGNGDLNCDGSVLDVADLVHVVDYMFHGGPGPCEFISPGVAYSSLDSAVNLPNEVYAPVLSLSIDCPSDGYVVLQVSGTYRKFGFLYEGVSFVLDTMAWTFAAEDAPEEYLHRAQVDFPNSNHELTGPWGLSAVMPVSAGEHTFWVSFLARGWGDPNNLYDITFSAMYFPVYYGTKRGENE